MNTDVKDISPTRRAIIVEVSSEEISSIESKLIQDFMRQAKVPGFRPGKAPENMIRTRYAKDIASELKSRVVSAAHQEGVLKTDVDIFGIVELDEGEIIAGQDATLTFTVDVMPDYELPVYEGLKVTTESVEADDAEIDTMFNQVLSQRAEFTVVEKAAEKGDYVRCSYEGTIEGQAITDLAPDAPIYGKQSKTWEEAGSEEAPGVRAVVDGLVGMSAGDKKEVEMEFPADFEVAALAGHTALYALEVEEVREKILPELDEAFFKSMQVKDESELRTQISQNITQQKTQKNFQSERQQITDQLLAAVDFPLPESGVASETDAILRDFMQRNMQRGATQEDFEKQKEQLHQGASDAAANRLKSRLILGRIAVEEKIQVENEDFSRVIMNEAMQTGQKPDQLVKELQKDQSRIDRMRIDILMGKTMDRLLEKAERETAEATA
ncbi:MAG: trigger factor [Coraliomargaritaceae bacterium]